MNDKQLVEQLQNKRTQNKAFEELLSLHKKQLYWHIRKIVLNHEDAHDVLQNTFIKVYRNINEFKGDSKLYTWLYRIATNESLSLLKSKVKQSEVESDAISQLLLDNLEADVYFEGDEIQMSLQKAIAELPEKQRLVFNMKYFDAMKYNDISEILGVSIGGLKANYHHAVKKIEAYLKSN